MVVEGMHVRREEKLTTGYRGWIVGSKQAVKLPFKY